MNAQWGTFTKNYNSTNCLSIAQEAMQNHGYQVYNPASSRDYMVIGGSGDVIVQVTCVPLNEQQTYMIVSAYPEDSSTAEQARNSIREDIQRITIIDF